MNIGEDNPTSIPSSQPENRIVCDAYSVDTAKIKLELNPKREQAHANNKKPTATAADNEKEKPTSPGAVEDVTREEDSEQPEPTFPQQLMDVIEAETLDENAPRVNGERVIEWSAKGESFIIRDKKALELQVLPKYFTAKCKFMSFVRKLYRWGFRQIEKKNQSGFMIFMHKNFRRGDKQRCLMMRSIVKKRDTANNPALGDVANQQSAAANATLQNFGMLNAINSMMGGSNSQLGLNLASAFNRMGTSPGLGLGMGVNSNNGTMNSNGMGSGALFNNNNTSSHFPQGFVGQGSSFTNSSQSMGLGTMTNAGNGNIGNSNIPGGQGNNFNLAAMSEVELASELMKRNPQIEPWKALDLAKAFKKSN